jgi:hypothetical protein
MMGFSLMNRLCLCQVYVSQNQSHSYFTTNGLPPISSSWRQAPWDPGPEFLFSNWTLAVIILTYHFWREDVSVYNCCWSSPAQSFSGPSPAGLMTIFYCLGFETPSTWGGGKFPYLYPPGIGWPDYTHRHWVYMRSHAICARAYSTILHVALARIAQKTPLLTVLLLRDVTIGADSIENTASNSSSIFACYRAIT